MPSEFETMCLEMIPLDEHHNGVVTREVLKANYVMFTNCDDAQAEEAFSKALAADPKLSTEGGIRYIDFLASVFEASGDRWYFAVGSAMNPVSLKGRGLVPIESQPATVLDHELGFKGSGGMAGAEPRKGASFHGVLHLMSKADMAKLDTIEPSNMRGTARARLYKRGVELPCIVYVRDPRKAAEVAPGEDAPPQQRYLEIMLEGCRHFGVHASHIAMLEAHERQPRKEPSEFDKMEVPDGLPTWGKAEVAAGDGKEGRLNYVILNGKVLEYVGDVNNPLGRNIVDLVSSGGRDIGFAWAHILYDPKYGMPKRPEDMTQEHIEACEDSLLGTGIFLSLVKVVAWFKR